jgi:hypothetical protein
MIFAASFACLLHVDVAGATVRSTLGFIENENCIKSKPQKRKYY